MLLDPAVYAVAAAGVFLAGVSKGGFGSGASFVATPLLALVIAPQAALGLLLPLLMVMDLDALRAYWRRWSVRETVLLCAAAVPGVVAAVLLQGVIGADTLRLLIGTIALAFVAVQLAAARGWIRPRATPTGTLAGILAGAVAGFTSFLSHAGGPPVLIWLLGRGLSRTGFQATTVAVFWTINLLKIGPYAWLGYLSGASLLPILTLLPVTILGTRAGIWAHGRIDDRLYFGVTYTLLTLTGAKLVWDGLT